jgi:predicted Zn-dependent protease
LGNRIDAMATGGGTTLLTIQSDWTGNLRWARNVVSTGGDIEKTYVTITRSILGAAGRAGTNALDDATLKTAVARAEELRLFGAQRPDLYPVPFQDLPQTVYPIPQPKLWFDDTAALDAESRAKLLDPIVKTVNDAGFLSAGYIEVGTRGAAVLRDTPDPVFRYYPLTLAQFSMTVRDAKSSGSGWAGVDFNEWARIDVAGLARIAIDKCANSRNPVAVEPGRYTAILEPQAVADLFDSVVFALERQPAEQGNGPFASPRRGFSKIGEKVLDERITVSSDPMDPDCGFVPFDWEGEPYQKVNWIDHGILRELAYYRSYGVTYLQKDRALTNPHAYRMSGGTTTVDEMIATTDRGVLVTRFSGLVVLDYKTLLTHAVTRDGLWLIEHGKISKPIKNFRITESPLFAFNNVEQLGAPQRVFHPSAPVVVPPIKVRDFSFTGLMDAV